MFWSGLTEAQAILISGILTPVVLAVSGAVGVFMFRGKITDLQSSLKETEELIVTYQTKITEILNEHISSSLRNFGELKGSVNDIQSVQSLDDTNDEESSHNIQTEQIDQREVLRINWNFDKRSVRRTCFNSC